MLQYLCTAISKKYRIMTKKNLLLSVMTLFVTNAHACFMYDVEGTPQPVNNVDPSKSNGPI